MINTCNFSTDINVLLERANSFTESLKGTAAASESKNKILSILKKIINHSDFIDKPSAVINLYNQYCLLESQPLDIISKVNKFFLEQIRNQIPAEEESSNIIIIDESEQLDLKNDVVEHKIDSFFQAYRKVLISEPLKLLSFANKAFTHVSDLDENNKVFAYTLIMKKILRESSIGIELINRAVTYSSETNDELLSYLKHVINAPFFLERPSLSIRLMNTTLLTEDFGPAITLQLNYFFAMNLDCYTKTKQVNEENEALYDDMTRKFFMLVSYRGEETVDKSVLTELEAEAWDYVLNLSERGRITVYTSILNNLLYVSPNTNNNSIEETHTGIEQQLNQWAQQHPEEIKVFRNFLMIVFKDFKFEYPEQKTVSDKDLEAIREKFINYLFDDSCEIVNKEEALEKFEEISSTDFLELISAKLSQR